MMNLLSHYDMGTIRRETTAARQKHLRTGVPDGVERVSAVEFS
jgi:hypothetical protein